MATRKFEYAKRKRPRGYEHTILVLDGIPIEDSWVHEFQNDRSVVVDSVESSTRLSEIVLSELFEEFSSVSVGLDLGKNEFIRRGFIEHKPSSDDKQKQQMVFISALALEHWARPWSVAEMADMLQRVISERSIPVPQYYQFDLEDFHGFGMSFPLQDYTSTIADLIVGWSPIVNEIVEKTVARLLDVERHDSLITFFNFPSTVRVACQQYLLYFIQFLGDLGIEADAQLKEDAHRVLFCVTPRSGPEALEQIREALNVYLRLPEAEDIVRQSTASGEIAVQQLYANVLHLQSQLALGSATLQAKDATIEALRIANFQYKRLMQVSDHRLVPYSTTLTESENKEELLGGLLAVTEYKGRGFEVNLPKILRMLKRRLLVD